MDVRIHPHSAATLTSMDVFLQINGLQLKADEADAVLTIRDVATGVLKEAELATWIKDNSIPFDLDMDQA